MAYSTRRYIAEYRGALKNEISIDELSFGLAKTSPNERGHFPRPAKWLHKYTSQHATTRTAICVIAHLWRLSCGGGFHFTMFLLLLWNKIRTPHIPKNSHPAMQKIGLGFSSRAVQVVLQAMPDEAPGVWIMKPSLDSKALTDEGGVGISALSLVSYRELFRAFIVALISTRAFTKDTRLSRWILQTYTAVEWFVCRIALENRSGSYFTAEHFDRWAILADVAVKKNKHREKCRTGLVYSKLCLVQHGSVFGLSGKPDTTISPPTKLKSVDELYCYNKGSEKIFRRNILSVSSESKIITRTFRPSIELSSKTFPLSKEVLFVGHPNCGDLHSAVYKNLCKELTFRAYFKPHPVDGAAEVCVKQSWIVVNELTHFPSVDLLISYPSTLVEEYSAHGIPAIVHPMDFAVEDANKISAKALDLLSNMTALNTPDETTFIG